MTTSTSRWRCAASSTGTPSPACATRSRCPGCWPMRSRSIRRSSTCVTCRAATGLTALATLRELAPGTKTIISTTDEGENRSLYLLRPSSSSSRRRCWPSARTRSLPGPWSRPSGAATPPPARAPTVCRAAVIRPPLLDQLVHNRTELALAGARPFRQAPGNRQRRARPPADARCLHRGEGRRHRRGYRSFLPAGRGPEPRRPPGRPSPGPSSPGLPSLGLPSLGLLLHTVPTW